MQALVPTKLAESSGGGGADPGPGTISASVIEGEAAGCCVVVLLGGFGDCSEHPLMGSNSSAHSRAVAVA